MNGKHSDPRIDLYVDDAMTPSEREQFQAAAGADPELADAMEMQAWIDREMKDIYAYEAPAVDPAAAAIAQAGRVAERALDEAPAAIPMPRRRVSWWKPLAMAAAVLIAAAGLWYIATMGGGSGTTPGRFVAPEKVYQRLVDRGWTPEFICTDDAEFREAVRKRLGAPLAIASMADVKVLGWAYNAGFPGKIIGDRTLLMLTDVEGKHVLVMMDLKESDRSMEVDPASGLSLFKRNIGPFVVYEITPFKEQRVLPLLREP